MVKKPSVNKSKNREKRPLFSKNGLSSLVFDIDNFNHSSFLQSEGKRRLSHGDTKGLSLFELATEFDSGNPVMLYEQGLALSEHGKETKIKKYLLLANKSFKAATKLDPNYFSAWQAWGKNLTFLGNLFHEYHFFLESKAKYEKAITLTQGVNNEELADFYWQYGSIMRKIASHSKEIYDLNKSLEAHALVLSYKEDMPIKFWQDYGNLSLKLGIQVSDIRLYLKAIHCYKQGISKSLSNADCWHYLGIALSELYELTYDEDHFCQANECFTNAAKLHPQNMFIWKEWARLLKNSGIRLRDIKRLHSAVEKCHKAYLCNRKDIQILLTWSEALAHLGLVTDRLDLIYEAGNKATEAEDRFSLSPEIYHAIGVYLFTLGKYHNDPDYYYQAIEKFQEGLSMCRVNHKLWFHLGHTYFILADLENDLSLFERAQKFFQKAIHLQRTSTYFYALASSIAKLAEANQDAGLIDQALSHYEEAFNLQKNAVYLKPEWLYQYALALDLKGDMSDDEKCYVKSLEILKRVLMLDPEFPDVHYKIAVVYSHLGELVHENEAYQRAIAHYKIAYQKNEENDLLVLDWGLTLINLAEVVSISDERDQLLKEAEYKLTQAAKLGNTEVFYHLACLYSLMMHYERSIYYLERAEEFDALPSLDEVLEDDWLENLRQTEIFRSFINTISGK